LHSEMADLRTVPGACVSLPPTTMVVTSTTARVRLWSASTSSFNGPMLRRAIITRGWTAQEFAEACDLTAACIYSALRGRRVRDRTALKIFRGLTRRQPSTVEE